MTTVYFVRHAKPDFCAHDESRSLSIKGQEDTELVCNFFLDKDIDIVASSPLKRAIETIKPFANLMNKEIEIYDGFKERILADYWIEDFDAIARKQWENFDYKLNSGESLRETQRRNMAELNKILERYKDKKIIIGSHGTSLSTIINYYDNDYGYEDFVKMKDLMPWIVKFVFDDKKLIEIEKIEII